MKFKIDKKKIKGLNDFFEHMDHSDNLADVKDHTHDIHDIHGKREDIVI